MSNMSYCRFRNTLADLNDCHDAMEDGPEGLSAEEFRARLAIIKRCVEIAEDYGQELEPAL